MSNRQYMKKKPQNKSYSPSAMQIPNFDKPDRVDTQSMGPLYEQIKNEVVSSVLNWLSMYMAADQEDRRISEQKSDVEHCCECTIKNKRANSLRSSFSTPYSKNLEVHGKDFEMNASFNDSEPSSSFFDSDLMPLDSNMELTEYTAVQVWPEWCHKIDLSTEAFSKKSASDCPVYFDKVNGCLCMYRCGLVEYPRTSYTSAKNDISNSSSGQKQNLKVSTEIRESLAKEQKDTPLTSICKSFNQSNETIVKGYDHRDLYIDENVEQMLTANNND